jgi:hypothetical protein
MKYNKKMSTTNFLGANIGNENENENDQQT